MNMELIRPNDPRYFTDTSSEPYDRHQYEFVYSNGQSRVFDSWEELEVSGLIFLHSSSLI